MANLIDKAAVVAEIEKRIKEYATIDEEDSKVLDLLYGPVIHALTEILSFINTLEVKEVDLTVSKNNWSPSKKQIDSLRDLLNYNIGVFDERKFMEVVSLYEDLSNSKL